MARLILSVRLGQLIRITGSIKFRIYRIQSTLINFALIEIVESILICSILALFAQVCIPPTSFYHGLLLIFSLVLDYQSNHPFLLFWEDWLALLLEATLQSFDLQRWMLRGVPMLNRFGGLKPLRSSSISGQDLIKHRIERYWSLDDWFAVPLTFVNGLAEFEVEKLLVVI